MTDIELSIETTPPGTVLADIDGFLRDAKGVVHIGANIGQEREMYNKLELRVLWIEPIPQLFNVLKQNIERYPKQRALQYLLTDQVQKAYEFKISNNMGRSSSIFDLAEHRTIWPHIDYIGTVTLRSETFNSMCEKERINLEHYDALVLDTQGSEFLVLKGAEAVLGHFKFIKVEAADFEAYSGCCRVQDIADYLAGFGFQETLRTEQASHPGGGKYFEIVYSND